MKHQRYLEMKMQRLTDFAVMAVLIAGALPSADPANWAASSTASTPD